MRSPSGHEYAELSLPPRLPYPSSRTASIPPRTRSDHHMQPSRCSLFPVPLSTHMSSHIREPSSPATTTPRQEIDDYRPQSDDHGCSSLPPAVPLQVMLERAQAYRPFIVQKPLYACPLCPRDFQLPNGLALHLKWHDRVGNLTMNSTPYLSRHPQQRVTPKHPHTDSGPLDTREVRHSQLPAQDDGQQSAISGSPPVPYSAPQETNPAQTESMTSSSRGQYSTSALSYERQPQECALFHDALQLTYNVDNDTYLAPLDGFRCSSLFHLNNATRPLNNCVPYLRRRSFRIQHILSARIVV
ncbi:hypothetical protein BJV77DRAFT_244618 [Russula vinacea]|nr:hypothetical protein BJV77DRAFT_244618 [Russula vinacea]